jgi:hypothetical protein
MSELGEFQYEGSSTVRNAVFFRIRSLTPPQAAGNALAFAVQGLSAMGGAEGLVVARAAH